MGTPLRPGPSPAAKPGRPAGAARSADAVRPEEAAILERARAGDAQAFRQLVEQHQDRAYTLALRILGSAAEAEETAQDAFMRAWLALPGFRGEASFSTWLHRIVVNRALDRAARLRRRAALEAGPGSAGEAAGAADTAGGTEEATRSRRLEAMIQLLPPAQRAAITLYYYEDRSVAEVARTLGVPPGTVKTHLSRARRALRDGWLRRERMDER
jgi:RNA polymerase sigma-70 factor (ECF subfamily)